MPWHPRGGGSCSLNKTVRLNTVCQDCFYFETGSKCTSEPRSSRPPQCPGVRVTSGSVPNSSYSTLCPLFIFRGNRKPDCSYLPDRACELNKTLPCKGASLLWDRFEQEKDLFATPHHVKDEDRKRQQGPPSQPHERQTEWEAGRSQLWTGLRLGTRPWSLQPTEQLPGNCAYVMSP